jgi:1-acyl-sn-glycerol-3-phosphate acyltransferase
MAMALAPRLGQREHVAPIEAAALGQYRFFERLGFFGIEPGSSAGYQRLLEVADQVLVRDDAAFWITPQGHFADVRARPLGLRPGVGHLVHRLRGGAVLPVALEYTFWAERLPEALAYIGEPMVIDDGRERSPEAWTEEVERGLSRAQDELAQASIARDEGAFELLVQGRSGFGRVYDLWRRLTAALRGERAVTEHGALVRARRGEVDQ